MWSFAGDFIIEEQPLAYASSVPLVSGRVKISTAPIGKNAELSASPQPRLSDGADRLRREANRLSRT